MMTAMGDIVSIRPSADTWLARGAAAESERDLTAAAIAYERAVLAAPGRADCLLKLADVRRRLYQWDEAERTLHRILDTMHDCLPAWQALAALYGERGDDRRHRFCLGWLLMLDPTCGETRRDFALALEAAGEAWRAKRHWITLLRNQPNGPDADLARRKLAE